MGEKGRWTSFFRKRDKAGRIYSRLFFHLLHSFFPHGGGGSATGAKTSADKSAAITAQEPI
jgi:hypothetical protein